MKSVTFIYFKRQYSEDDNTIWCHKTHVVCHFVLSFCSHGSMTPTNVVLLLFVVAGSHDSHSLCTTPAPSKHKKFPLSLISKHSAGVQICDVKHSWSKTDRNRLPRKLPIATCVTRGLSDSLFKCTEVFYHVPVMRKNRTTRKWDPVWERVAVNCKLERARFKKRNRKIPATLN